MKTAALPHPHFAVRDAPQEACPVWMRPSARGTVGTVPLRDLSLECNVLGGEGKGGEGREGRGGEGRDVCI